MRSPKFRLSAKSATGWAAAVQLTEAYLHGSQKADQLLDALPEDFSGDRRAACQSLFLGGLRHGHRTKAALTGLLRKKAKPGVEAILLVTGFELQDAPADRHPKIIHHAVEQSKRLVNRFEQGFLNAVLRKLPEALGKIDCETSPAAYFSHPEWLVARWKQEFPDNCSELLEWNQSTPESYVKLYTTPDELPEGLITTQWDHFYRVDREASWKDVVRPLLNRGDAYIKDPSTRLAPALLAPRAGERVLDLCAAPGGKAFDLAHAMEHEGTLVAVDLPGPRIARLRNNLESLKSDTLRCHVLESDLLDLGSNQFEQAALPSRYDAVMLDAPCSNTGVIQRRTDVKWRLRKGDIEDCSRLQQSLLAKAAMFVDDGGRLVYSTCSIETAENRAVVDAFLESESGRRFELAGESISLPWETGHDGAGAFLLKRLD